MIPVVDLAGADDGPAAGSARKRIADACSELGMFQIVGHGIDPASIDAVERSSREFFSLADSEKARHVSPSGNPYSGWATTDVRRGDRLLRFQEQFQVSRFDGPDDLRRAGYDETWAARAEPNCWPAAPPDLEPSWRRYIAEMDMLGRRLLELVAPHLGVSDDWPSRAFGRPASFLACNRYLPVDDGPPQRLEEHTDFGSFTILHHDDGPGGLQVRTRSGSWHDVRAVPGALVINLGDLFTIWTGGAWSAPEHRVLAAPPGARETRMSIAYFQNPDLDVLLEPLPAFAGQSEQQPHADPVTAGEWIRRRMAEYQAP